MRLWNTIPFVSRFMRVTEAKAPDEGPAESTGFVPLKDPGKKPSDSSGVAWTRPPEGMAAPTPYGIWDNARN